MNRTPKIQTSTNAPVADERHEETDRDRMVCEIQEEREARRDRHFEQMDRDDETFRPN